MRTEDVLFALLRAEICTQQLGEEYKTALTTQMIEAVYTLAKKHDLAHLVGQTLGRLHLLKEDEVSRKLKQAAMQAMQRYVWQDREYNRLCKTLEEAEIPFIPLKGSVLRPYYPEAWMRTSSDIDVLVKETALEEAKEVLESKLQYTAGERGDHDIAMCSPSRVMVELHYDTIQQRYAADDWRRILAGIWEDAVPKEGCRYHCRMSDAMFYYYHMAHMAKHFGNGGCGIRPVMDIWIMNHKMEFDRQKRETLLKEGGLYPFARSMEQLCDVWFSGKTADGMTQQVISYILTGGVYGNTENRAAFGQAKTGGKLRYILLQRVFMPYDFLKAEYPILKKHKWLTPVYQVVRWFRMIFSGQAKDKFRELKANSAASKKDVASLGKLMDHLGLK